MARQTKLGGNPTQSNHDAKSVNPLKTKDLGPIQPHASQPGTVGIRCRRKDRRKRGKSLQVNGLGAVNYPVAKAYGKV